VYVHPKLSNAAPSQDFVGNVGGPAYLGSALGMVGGAGIAALIAAKRRRMPSAHNLVLGGAAGELLGAGGGIGWGLRKHRRAKQSGLMRDEYDVSFVPEDDTETQLEGTVTVPFGSIPLLRRLFKAKAHGFDGVTEAEILDAVQVGGAGITGLPRRTAMGFESIHGYRPLDVHVTKTAARRAWYRLRS